MKNYDVIIVGGGAAGLTAAGAASAAGRRVAVLDMGAHPARKVSASGGGRCNFTNTAAEYDRYFGKNPQFVRGALKRVSPTDILNWAAAHGIKYTQKNPGQYFTTTTAGDVVGALLRDAGAADIFSTTTVISVAHNNNKFITHTNNGDFSSDSVIVATGGISFPTLAVSDTGYKIAKSFGHKIIPPRPALCAIDTNAFPHDWAGISVPVRITVMGRKIDGDMLFTHFGIGGPAVYSASVAANDCDIHINFMPNENAFDWLRGEKHKSGKRHINTVLSTCIPAQVARHFCSTQCNIADMRDDDLKKIAAQINDFVIPARTWRHHGMQSAEVTFGGVDTAEISSKTMESKIVPGLFFAGEVMDITGDLGGFNLQWAWASGRVAGMNA